MNERIIWDFVSKAREFAVSDTLDGGKCFDSDVFHNKFAELIVQECAQQCWTVSELESKGFVVSECAKKIRKHFGVEE